MCSWRLHRTRKILSWNWALWFILIMSPFSSWVDRREGDELWIPCFASINGFYLLYFSNEKEENTILTSGKGTKFLYWVFHGLDAVRKVLSYSFSLLETVIIISEFCWQSHHRLRTSVCQWALSLLYTSFSRFPRFIHLVIYISTPFFVVLS